MQMKLLGGGVFMQIPNQLSTIDNNRTTYIRQKRGAELYSKGKAKLSLRLNKYHSMNTSTF